jgi:ribosomal protein S10
MYKITLSSSSKKSLNLYIKFLSIIFKSLNIDLMIFNLPTTKKRIALLKSPHVYKKAKEHFEIQNFRIALSFNSSIKTETLKYLLFNKPKSVILKLTF